MTLLRRAVEPIGPYTLLRVERGDARAGRSRASSSCSRRRAGVLPRPMSALPCARGRARVPDRPDRAGDACALRARAAATSCTCSARSGNGFDLDVERPLLVGGGIGDRAAAVPLGGSSAARPRSSASAATGTPRRPRSCPNAEVCIEPTLRDRAAARGADDVLACGPEPMLAGACARSCRTRSSPGRPRWRAATAPATAAPSRSTAS